MYYSLWMMLLFCIIISIILNLAFTINVCFLFLLKAQPRYSITGISYVHT